MLTSRELELYFLPDGGTRGIDEIPVHSNFTALSLEREIRDGLKRGNGLIQTWGQTRKTIEPSLSPGKSGILTILDRKPSNLTQHFQIFVYENSVSYPFDGRIEAEIGFQTLGPVYQGAYTVDHRYGRIRMDQGDGTFLERPLIYTIPLDELIMNRGWT